jgi:hypothetical protein
MPDNLLDPHFVNGWQAGKEHVGMNILKADLDD